MPGVTLPPSPQVRAQQPFSDPSAMLAYIRAGALRRGLDPNAVLAVAVHEGISLPAQVGDQGTSFGPWQLHEGGALPSWIASGGPLNANAWANSPAGVDYALDRMAQVARGQTGATAIRSIVYGFERPTDPAGETAAAIRSYGQTPRLVSGISLSSGIGSAAQHIPGVVQGEAVVSGVESTASFIGKLTDPHYILRGLQIVAGGVLVLIGVYLLARQVGLAVSESTPQPIKDAAAAIPPVAAAREARAQTRSYNQGRTQGRRQAARREGRKAGRAEISSAERIRTRPEPVYSASRRTRPKTNDDIPF